MVKLNFSHNPNCFLVLTKKWKIFIHNLRKTAVQGAKTINKKMDWLAKITIKVNIFKTQSRKLKLMST